MSHHPAQLCRWHAVADASALASAASARVVDAASRAIRARGAFIVVLAGGNTPRAAYELLRRADADWAKWHVYFGDERCAPRDDPQRNSRMAEAAWLAHVAVPTAQVHEIDGELGAAQAARRAAQTLAGVPEFDLVLLGLGEDGHTASLFPGHEVGAAVTAPDALAVFDAPKPPPERVSLSAHRLGRSREVVFLVAGEEKRPAVERWRRGDDIPASAIAPPAGVDVLIEAGLLSPV